MEQTFDTIWIKAIVTSNPIRPTNLDPWLLKMLHDLPCREKLRSGIQPNSLSVTDKKLGMKFHTSNENKVTKLSVRLILFPLRKRNSSTGKGSVLLTVS